MDRVNYNMNLSGEGYLEGPDEDFRKSSGFILLRMGNIQDVCIGVMHLRVI